MGITFGSSISKVYPSVVCAFAVFMVNCIRCFSCHVFPYNPMSIIGLSFAVESQSEHYIPINVIDGSDCSASDPTVNYLSRAPLKKPSMRVIHKPLLQF